MTDTQKGGQNFGPHPGGPGGVPGQETPTLNQLLQSPSQRFHGPGPGGHGPGFPGSHQPWTAGHRPPGMGHPGYPGHPGMNPYAGHPGMIPPGHPAANGQHLRNGPPGMYGPRHPQYNHGQPHGDQLQERLPVPPNHPSQVNAHATNYGQPRLPTTSHHHQQPTGNVNSPNRPPTHPGVNGPSTPSQKPQMSQASPQTGAGHPGQPSGHHPGHPSGHPGQHPGGQPPHSPIIPKREPTSQPGTPHPPPAQSPAGNNFMPNGHPPQPSPSSSPAVKPQPPNQGTPPSAMAPPNVPGKDTSASPRPNVSHGQPGFPPNMNPRAHMGNPYGHFPPNGYGQRHPGHGGPGNFGPQRPGYPPGYPQSAMGGPHPGQPGGHPGFRGHPGGHPGFPGFPGQGGHPGQFPRTSTAGPTSQHAAAEAAAAAVAAARAQGQQGQPRPSFSHHPGHPGMVPNGHPGHPGMRPGFPPRPGYGPMPPYGMRPGGPSPSHPSHPSMSKPPHPHSSGFGMPASAQVKTERTADGPMSPASSIGENGDISSPRPGRPPSAASSQGSETPTNVTFKTTSAKNREKLKVLYDFPPEKADDVHKRRQFVDDLIRFHEERGQPLKGPPMFASAPLDVYKLYDKVKTKGGMNEVTKKKEWGEIVREMNFPVSPSAGFTLKKQYVKFLFEFECKLEHRPLDEDEIRKIVEQSTRGKKSKKSSKGQVDDRASPSSNPPMRTPPPGQPGQPQQGLQPGQPPQGLQPGQAPPGQSGQPMTSVPNSSGPGGMPPGFPNGHPAGPYGQPGMPGMYRHGDPNQPRPGWHPGMNGYRPPTSYPGGPPGPYPPRHPMFPGHGGPPGPYGPMVRMHQRPPMRPPMGSPGFGPRPGPYSQNPFPGPRPGFPGVPRHPSSQAGPLPPPSPSTSAPVPSHMVGPPRPMVPPQRPHVSLGQEPQHEQPRKPNRPRMHFPPDTVEALEPAMYNRVTARNARMEIDFWKQVMMPLKSGLVSESASALNILLVLSRDDSTLPQLNLNLLHGLLDAIMAHFKAVLRALFPEKTVKIGQKRPRGESEPTPEKTENQTETENIYKINFKKVNSSKLLSKHAGKRKLKIRNCRARLSLLAEQDYPKLSDPEENDTDHILLPVETEKVGDYKNPRGKWSEPLFPPPKSSNYLINGKEYDQENDKITLTPRQIEEIDDLEFHFSKGNEKRRKFEEIGFSSGSDGEYEADFFDLDEETVLNPHQEPKTLLARLHCLFAIIRNLSFLPANWIRMARYTELLEIITLFINKERLVRRKMSRHANFAPPEKFYLADKDNETPSETIEWLREIEPYWEKFFGNYTLLECSSILSCDNSWRKDLLNELSEDCMIIFNNLALEVNMIELTKAEVIINLLLHLAAIRASQNELPNIPDRPEPLDLYRMALETLVRLCTRDDNLDLILATRPFKRQQKIVKLLFENVQQDYCQILKELSITLLKQFILPQSPLTQYAAKIENSVKSLILFIENQTPDSSIHTRRLACEILVSMSHDRCNHSSLIQFEGKLADLFGNSLFHPDIQSKLADCLYQLTQH